MKLYRYIIYISIATALIFTSCKKEIEFKGEISEPLIVLNSFLNTDSLIVVKLSKSKFFLSNQTKYDNVNNAEISLYINSQYKEKLTFLSDGNYSSSIKPAIGDTVALSVIVDGYDEIKTSSIIPENVIILSSDTTYTVNHVEYDVIYDEIMYGEMMYDETIQGDTIAINKSGYLNFRIQIKDPSLQPNYYRLILKNIQVYKHNGNEFRRSSFFVPINLEGFEDVNGSVLGMITGEEQMSIQQLFTDEMFNGKEFTLKFKTDYMKQIILPAYNDYFPGGLLPDPETTIEGYYTVNLQSISKEMYLYLKSKEEAESTMNGLFTEPVQVYNNIKNGVGILGSYTNNEVTFEMK